MVEGLKGDLTKLEPILEQASKDAEKLLKQVEIDKADAAKVKEKVRLFFSHRIKRSRYAVLSGLKHPVPLPLRLLNTVESRRVGGKSMQPAILIAEPKRVEKVFAKIIKGQRYKYAIRASPQNTNKNLRQQVFMLGEARGSLFAQACHSRCPS